MNLQLASLAEQCGPEMISFCQQLIRTPSPSGDEQAVARLIGDEMKRLDYDQVWTDDWGNVIGLLRGRNEGSSIMFNGHMDHVDPGNPADWPYPPLGGEIHDGHMWGRGTTDMKGALAAMVHAVGLLARAGIRPPGDLYVAAVVQEEVGGLGTSKLVQTIRPDCAVVGEASSNQLARGHRGRVGLVAQVRGRSVHASVPDQGVNPHAVLARFVQRLETLELVSEDPFGRSTVAPTLIHADQASSNVIPGEIQLHLDWRNVPGETAEDILAQLGPVLDACLADVPGSEGEVVLNQRRLQTWTGKTETFPDVFPSYGLDAHHPLVLRGQETLCRALDRPVEVTIWSFATDGGHLMAAGVPTIGFGPGHAHTVHTVRERVPVSMLAEATLGYAALAMELGLVSQS
ncbi:MAG: M20/M25/M40 family metallo-hydrolase [Ardenticatenales bacterium]|nr:M20/M25/M40 family metallo-hydrolase [Ardenticatenales bacterium]